VPYDKARREATRRNSMPHNRVELMPINDNVLRQLL
jgi:hypothetical protein